MIAVGSGVVTVALPGGGLIRARQRGHVVKVFCATTPSPGIAGV